ncbi:MAG: hypothetical protein ACKVQW_00785 [Pyrinomonadaceae bacterium]
MAQDQLPNKKKEVKKSPIDFNRRFTEICWVTVAFGGSYILYLVHAWYESGIKVVDVDGSIKPFPPSSFFFWFVPTWFIIVILSIFGAQMKKSDESSSGSDAATEETVNFFEHPIKWIRLEWRNLFLYLVTGLFVLLLILPCLVIGGPFFSGFVHPLIGFAGLALVVTGSNKVRIGILLACLAGFVFSLRFFASYYLPDAWTAGHHVERSFEYWNELWHAGFVVLTLIVTIRITYDRKNNKSILDEISTVNALGQVEIEDHALKLDDETKQKIIQTLNKSISVSNDKTKEINPLEATK